MAEPNEWGEPCSRPKPITVKTYDWFSSTHTGYKVVCGECGFGLYAAVYEQGGNRMVWYRHARHDPPIALAASA